MPQALIRVSGTSPTTDATIKIELPRYRGIAEDYHNIRFRTMTGQVIPHWVEDTSKGVVWVKLPRISEAGTTFYVEWGNWNSGRGDIKNTFIIGDDFETLDTNKWDVQAGSGTIDIQTVDGYTCLHIGNYTNYYSYIQYKAGINPVGLVAVMRARIGNYSGSAWAFGHGWKDIFDTSTYSYIRSVARHSGDTSTNAPYKAHIERFYDGSLEARTDPSRSALNPLPADTWSRWKMRIDSSTLGYFISIIESSGAVINEDTLSWTTALSTDSHYAIGKRLVNSNYSTAGSYGNHYVDWIIVYKYLDPEPEVLDIRPIPSIEEILPYIVTTTAGTPFVISLGSVTKVGSDTSKSFSSREKVGASKEYIVLPQESVAQSSQRVVTSENVVGKSAAKEYAVQEKVGQETYPVHAASQETVAYLQELISASITKVARLKDVALAFQSRVGKAMDKNIETESVVASETVYQKLGVENKIATLRTLQTQLQEAVSELAERSIASKVKVGESVEYNISVITSLAESFESVLASVEKVYRALETHAGMESAVSEFSEKALAVVESVAESSEIVLATDISVKELILRILRTLVEVADQFRTLVEVVDNYSTTVE